MLLINKIQQSLYDILSSQTSENFSKLNGILNYVELDNKFPYIFISNDNILDISTTNKKQYSCATKINVFDNSTNNYFVNSIAEEIINLISDKNNIIISNCHVIDTKFEEFSISLENENTVWNGEIKFKIIIRPNQ